MKKYLKLIAILSVTFCTFLSTSSVVKVMALEGISTYDSVTEGGSVIFHLDHKPIRVQKKVQKLLS